MVTGVWAPQGLQSGPRGDMIWFCDWSWAGGEKTCAWPPEDVASGAHRCVAEQRSGCSDWRMELVVPWWSCVVHRIA